MITVYVTMPQSADPAEYNTTEHRPLRVVRIGEDQWFVGLAVKEMSVAEIQASFAAGDLPGKIFDTKALEEFAKEILIATAE